MSSKTDLSKIITVLGLVLLLGAIGLLTTRWGTTSQRSTTSNTPQQNSLKLLTASSQHAREHALQRQGRLRQTKAANNTSLAALHPVQPPEQPLDNDHQDHTDQHLLSVHSASASSPEPQLSVSHLFTDSPAEDTQHDSSGRLEKFSTAEMPAEMQALDSHLSAEEEAARCKATIGYWCQHALRHQVVINRSQPVSGNQTCRSDCNGVGNCNALTGICDCPAGWKGDGCLMRDPRPCTDRYRMGGSEPNGPPKSWSEAVEGPVATGRCHGVCDNDIAACFCNGTYGWESPYQGSGPQSYPPKRQGRPMGLHCQPNKGDDGTPLHWGQHDPAKLFHPETGWCEAAAPHTRCECFLDGMGGDYCDQPHEQTCMNQCSGHGMCHLGFCKCDPGYFGHDCANRAAGAAASGGFCRAGVDLTERPWLQGLVSAAEQPQQRRRPLIYVYDLPAEFNSRMLQYRLNKRECVWRQFTDSNQSIINTWTYGIENAFHERLLQSEHRTLDPEEADFFYMPVYTSCFLHPVWGYVDHPWYYGPTIDCHREVDMQICQTGANRVMQAMFMLLEARRWVDTNFPYWRRRAGRDHIWLITHDEGSCWAPKEIRSSIILSHWGRKDVNHTSNSAYLPWDNYTQEIVHPQWWPQGYTHHIRGHACYNPMKDLVIPNLKHPAEFANSSPLVGHPQPQRDILFLFRGDVGKARLPHYSRGIRQRLFRLAQEQDWAARHSILIGGREDIPGDYSELLTRSRFCLVAPGDGFSPRAEDAVLHGCIPVVVMDDVDPVFSSILDWDAFSIRIAEADVERLPHILLAVSQARLQAMQRALRSVWQRFMWSSLPIFRGIVRSVCELNAARTNASAVSLDVCCGDFAQDDAFATVMQWLSFKAVSPGATNVGGRRLA